MAYSFNTDCVVIANSNLQIESYSYQSMKVFTNNDLDAQRDKQAKNEAKSEMERAWVSNIGE
jgi:hypothetical protein